MHKAVYLQYEYIKQLWTFRLALEQNLVQQRDGLRDDMNDIGAEPPFQALGFFNISRSTLTSLLGTILTYLIVLVQFKQSSTDLFSDWFCLYTKNSMFSDNSNTISFFVHLMNVQVLFTIYNVHNIHKCGKVKKIKDNNVSKAVLQCIPLNEIFLTTFCITASRIVERHSNSSLYFNFMPDIKITWNPYLLENLIKSHTTKSIKPHSKSLAVKY